MPLKTLRRVILVGMMGSGKSTVGRLLAGALGWPYLDNDELLLEATGRTAHEMAGEGGEPAVRAAEAAALRAGLNAPGPAVVGAAAGTIVDPVNRLAMADAGVVVWLRARPETLAVRAGGAAHRPWLDRDALEWFRVTTANGRRCTNLSPMS